MPDKHTCPGCGAEYDPESGEAHFHEPGPPVPEPPVDPPEPESVPLEPVPPAPAPRARNRFRKD